MLKEIESKYQWIMQSDKTVDEKDFALRDLMDLMEENFKIPILRNLQFEKDNIDVIVLYRKISNSRKFDDEEERR